jgi:heme exporter protein A
VLSTAIRPHRGSVTIDGWDLTRHRDDIRKSVALLTHASYLYEPLTGLENLRIFADHLGKSRAGLMPLLERVGLATRANDPVSAYSAGMRKRLSFARVLLQEPRVVMLDEPYGQLDPEGFALVDEVVCELRERGATVLMATHQIERGTKLCDAAVFLEAGRVVRAC